MNETTENQVSRDVAEVEFDRFAEEMDLDVDESRMDAEDRTAFDKQKNRIICAIERGHLVINEDGEAVYTPHHRKTKQREAITFHERSGASLMAQDGKKKNQEVGKTYAIMGDMCKVHPSVFANMYGTDIKTCEAIYALLMD
jgi:hypothetical protein